MKRVRRYARPSTAIASTCAQYLTAILRAAEHRPLGWLGGLVNLRPLELVVNLGTSPSSAGDFPAFARLTALRRLVVDGFQHELDEREAEDEEAEAEPAEPPAAEGGGGGAGRAAALGVAGGGAGAAPGLPACLTCQT